MAKLCSKKVIAVLTPPMPQVGAGTHSSSWSGAGADGMIPLSIGLHFDGTQNGTAPGIQLAVILTRIIFATLRIDAQCRLRDKLGSLEK